MSQLRTRDELLLALALTILAGCGEDESVGVRVQNASPVDFQSVIAGLPDGRQELGPLAAGGASEYHYFDDAFASPSFNVHFDADSGRIQPIDSFGERLERGLYTYRLTLNPESDSEFNRIRLVLVHDAQ